MKRLAVAAAGVLLGVSAVSAQNTFGFAAYDAPLSTASENPPIVQNQGTGHARILIHTVRNATGDLTSAVVDFTAEIVLTGEETVTQFHIHRGARGVNGPVVVNPAFSPPVTLAAGQHTLFRHVQVTSEAGLATIQAILDNPAGFYFNLHSTSFPGGLLRGQLEPGTLDAVMQNAMRIQDLKAENESLRAEVHAVRELLQRIAFRMGLVGSPTP
jgi:hypothetical protein